MRIPERLRTPLALLGLAGLIVVTFAPVLWGERMATDNEHVGGYLPSALFFSDAIRAGTSYLWNSHYLAGFPGFLNYSSGYLYPVHWILFRILPPISAFHAAVLLATCIGAVASFGFGRLSGFSRAASFFLAASYLIGQTFIGLFTGLFYVVGYQTLPVVAFGVLLASSGAGFGRRALGTFIAALGVAAGFLAGFPQTVFYGLIFVAAFVLFHDFSVGGLRAVFLRYGASWTLVVSIAIGALLGAPQLVPEFSHLKLSVRNDRYTAESSRLAPPGTIITFFLPKNQATLAFPGASLTFYSGVLPLFFALLALLFFRNRQVWFFFGAYLLITAMGLHLPGVRWINTELPILRNLSNVNRWPLIGSFPLAWLGAYGFDRWRRVRTDEITAGSFRRYWYGLAVFVALIAAGALTLIVGFRVLSSSPELRARILEIISRGRSLRLAPEHYRAVLDMMVARASRAFSFTSWQFIAPVLLYPAALAALLFFRRRSTTSLAVAAITIIMAADLGVAFASSWPDLGEARLYDSTPAVVQAIRAGESNPRTYRIYPWIVGDGAFELYSGRVITQEQFGEINREILTHNTNTVYGLDSAWGYEVMRTRRMNQIHYTVINPFTLHTFDADAVRNGGHIDQIFNAEALRPATLEEKQRDFETHLPFLRMMNVQYVYSPLPIPSAQITEIPTPVEPVLGVPVRLYKLPEPLPRAYFAAGPTLWQGSDERELLLAVAAEKDFSKHTYLECASCSSDDIKTGSGRVDIERYDDGAIILKTDSNSGGWVVLTESNLPGWEVRIDGAPATVATANYLFMGVHVPAGSHRITFDYIGEWRQKLDRLYATFKR